MYVFKIISLSFSSIIILFILTKLIENKQMSQLTMFDYIVGITIGSIAAEMATALDNNFLEPLIAMIVYALVTITISFISSKSLMLRRIFLGKTLILLDNGQLYRNNFKKAKLDLSEFFTQCRTNGFFNLNDIQTALLEPNGKISFLSKSEKRYLTPEDQNITVTQEKIPHNLILDGKIIKSNLKFIGLTEEWLYNKLEEQGYKKVKNIFLATYDSKSNLSIYKNSSFHIQ